MRQAQSDPTKPKAWRLVAPWQARVLQMPPFCRRHQGRQGAPKGSMTALLATPGDRSGAAGRHGARGLDIDGAPVGPLGDSSKTARNPPARAASGRSDQQNDRGQPRHGGLAEGGTSPGKRKHTAGIRRKVHLPHLVHIRLTGAGESLLAWASVPE
jgi:hypothetical protein